MRRHRIELWTDQSLQELVVSWRIESLDEDGEEELVCDSLVMAGRGIHALRAFSRVLVMSELVSPRAAAQEIKLVGREDVPPPRLWN